MSKKVKVILKKKRPLDSYLDRKSVSLTKELVGRFRPAFMQTAKHVNSMTKKALGTDGAPSLTDVDALLSFALSLITPEGSELVQKYTAQTFAYGVAQFQMGLDSALVGEVPRAAQVEEVMSQPRFLDRRALEFAQSSTYLSTLNRDTQQISSFLRQLLVGIEDGENPVTIAQRTATELEQNPGQWVTLARSEMANALAQGAMDEARRLNVEYVYVPSHPDASEACQRLIQGRLFGRDWLQGQSNVGKKAKAWGPAVPCHPNCRHTVLPASRSLLKQVRAQIGSQDIPVTGVKVDYKPPSER